MIVLFTSNPHVKKERNEKCYDWKLAIQVIHDDSYI